MIQSEEFDIIEEFWIEELKQFQNNNSQEKTFWEIFCNQINLDLNEAVQWLKEEFSPGEAKEWMNKGFSLKQAKEWRNNKVLFPEGVQYCQQYWQNEDVKKKINRIVYQVFCSGQVSLFDSGEIDIWIKAGFSPGEAKQWIAAGSRSPKEAAAWIFAGFLSPEEAAIWRDAEFSPAEATAWKVAGFSLSQAIGLRAKYGSPLKALKALKRDTLKKDASEAWEILNNTNNPPNNPPNFPSPNT